MSDIALRVRDIGKRYRIGVREQGYKTFREALVDAAVGPIRNLKRLRSLTKFAADNGEGAADDIIWALKDVSFDVKEGEVVGIIGANGAGKSTLLKILSRITEPTTGYFKIKGRVSSLLEVGTGFHPELTGRENVYLNAAVLGMRKKEIDRKFDEIVDFSGVEKFIDTPVKRYSSGMQVRLAFAVAAHLEPEILIVDEVLAVGDATFQKKCLGKMSDVAKEGRTVLFVSHNMGAISALCSKGVLLSQGTLVGLGSTAEIISAYQDTWEDSSREVIADRRDRRGDGSLRMQDVWIEDSAGRRRSSVACGEKLSIKILYKGNDIHRSLKFLIAIYNDHNQRVLGFDSETKPPDLESWPSVGTVRCDLTGPFPLSPGRYRINIAVLSVSQTVDYLTNVLSFDVMEGDFFGTGKLPNQIWPMFLVDNEWTLE